MLTQLKALFAPEAAEASTREHALQLACAALMMEVATIDNHFDDTEQASLVAQLQKQFSLDVPTADELSQLAKQARHDATSLHQFTSEINQHCSADEKYQLILSMWHVAFADGHLDRYEEYIIRRAAELLYVSHSDFIRAKLDVKSKL